MKGRPAIDDKGGNGGDPAPVQGRHSATPNDLTLGYKILRAAFTLATIKSLHLRSVALDQVSVKLEEEDLWNEFNNASNEMIITKLGRCLFPTVKVSLQNLNPALMYAVGIDFVMVGTEKCKFKGPRKGWVNSTTNQPNNIVDSDICDQLKKLPITEVHEYADSPKRGEYWNKNLVSFSKLKLTNKFQSLHKTAVNHRLEHEGVGGQQQHSTTTGRLNSTNEYSIMYNADGIFPLHSFHKYIPRIHVMHVPNEYSRRILKRQILGIKTFIFPQTSFIAVTHYQNNAVNLLKKNYNPHAKGFKDYCNSSGSSSSLHSMSAYKITKRLPGKQFKESQSSSDSDYFSSEEI